jgi:uncharacterized protein (DUF2384 family)
MSSPGTALAEPINALDLATRMGISLDVLSAATNVNIDELRDNPRSNQGQDALRKLASIWDQIVIVFGNEARGRVFLEQERPELEDKSPIYYLKNGRRGVVENLVFAIREMLP